MIISFMGPPGSGKSTVAKMVAKKLGWPRYYMGELFRQKARERGVTVQKYCELGKTDIKIDLEVDEYQKELGEKEDNFVIEGRTSWHFIPHSVKIYLDVDAKIAAERVFAELQKSQTRNDEDKNLNTVEDVLKSQQKRIKADSYRYQKFFNINSFDKTQYDLVINTTNLRPEQIVEKIMKFIAERLSRAHKTPVDKK